MSWLKPKKTGIDPAYVKSLEVHLDNLMNGLQMIQSLAVSLAAGKVVIEVSEVADGRRKFVAYANDLDDAEKEEVRNSPKEVDA